MRSQVMLEFDTKEEATTFAEKNEIPYQVFEPAGSKGPRTGLFGQFPLRQKNPLEPLAPASAISPIRPRSSMDRATAF